MRTRTSTAVVATLALAAVMTAPTPAVADWLGLNVSDRGVGLSLGVGWDAYGDSWNDPNWSVSYDTELNGYGDWISVPGLGRVWMPFVTADWRPYTHGRWMHTDMDWTWVSYEPWGFFPHHYGEWAFTDFGWVWVPGYTYRPANVFWLTVGDFIGWYPCGPAGWSHHGHGFHSGYRHGYRDGYGDGWNDARYATFVNWRDVGAENVGRLAVAADRVARNVTRTALRAVPKPPSMRDVEQRAGRPLPQARIERREVRIGDRAVTVARPEGMARSVETHARETVDRALAPQARERLRTVERQAKPASVERRATGSERLRSDDPRPQERSAAPEQRRRQTPPANLERNSTATGRRPVGEDRIEARQPERRQPSSSVERSDRTRRPESATPQQLGSDRRRGSAPAPQAVAPRDSRRSERIVPPSREQGSVRRRDSARAPEATRQPDVRRRGSEVRPSDATRQPEVRRRDSVKNDEKARETKPTAKGKRDSNKDQRRNK